MKRPFSFLVLFAVTFFSLNMIQASQFSEASCEKYYANETFAKALNVVAANMKSTSQELCSLERLFDVYIVNHTVITPKGEEIPHVWLTLHYAEHSCQYFVRNADLVVTAKNCYNTW